MHQNDKLLIVRTTCDSKDALDLIAIQIIQKKLGACCQVGGPVTSTYSWKGTVESSKEWILEIKATMDRFEAISNVILEHHPYDVPQIIGYPVTHVTQDYLDWVQSQV
ncbi:MAG: divalent-cation tolerance protein CutA [Planctomycetota bacterium]